jgi:hypothetical protein
MLNKLKAWFWRDPDPIWRWASGQTVRRWWKHPMAFPAAAPVVCALGVAALFAAYPANAAGDAIEVGYWASYFLVAGCHLVLFLHVAATPFVMLGRLGGPPALRELSLTLLPRQEIARLLYLGSFRRAALPSLAILLTVEIVFTYFGIASGEIDFEPGERFPFVFVFIIKPPLDYLMNLAISWWQYFSTGSLVYGRFRAMAILMGLFPAAGYLMMVFSNSTYAFLIIYAAKGVYAIYCCQEMYLRWNDRLRERFGEK